MEQAAATWRRMNSATAAFGAGPKRRAGCPGPSSTTALRTAPMPSPGRLTSLATIQSRFFAASLRRAEAATSCVSAANPTTT